MNNLFKQLDKDKISLSYLGPISDGITDKFTGLSESYLKNSSQLGKISNRTCFLIAECFQNTIRHREDGVNLSGHRDFFHLGVHDNGVVLCTSNLIRKEHIAGLKEKITHINSLDTGALKSLHHEVLTGTEGLSAKGGAGLGLIEMARKSSLPLKFNFREKDADMAEFFLALELRHPGETLPVARVSNGLENELKFYEALLQDNILMLFKGEFSREIVAPLIQMMDVNILGGKEIADSEKKGLITFIEVIQNILNHAKVINGGKSGIFSISNRQGRLVIEGGNFVEESKVDGMMNILGSLKNMKMEDVMSLYKQRMAVPEITPEGNSGLGLLEIARNSSMDFTYDFDKSSEPGTFFTLKINL